MAQPTDDRYGVPVHVFFKNKREQIRISLNEFQGHQYIDVRQFYDDKGEFKPTSKGVTLRKDLYTELLKGVIELGEVLGVSTDGDEGEPK